MNRPARLARRLAFLPALLLLAAATPPARGDAAPESRVDLENGLRVLLRPLRGTGRVSLCTVFDIGEDHDPRGASGLARLIERCWFTSAAGATPARNVDAVKAAYPLGWHRTTGSTFTSFGVVFPAERLAAEMQDAAARMLSLGITPADVDRERADLIDEIHETFEEVPVLTAQANAREMVRPSASGARHGGRPEEISKRSADELRAWHERYYKPRNAWLALAGDFDPRQVEDLVLQHFSTVPPGDLPPPPPARPAPTLGQMQTLEIGGLPPGTPGSFCVAFAAPGYGSPQAAAFQILVARLLRAQMLQRSDAPVEVRWSLLDEPEVLYAYAPLPPGEDPNATFGRALGYLQEVIRQPLTPQDPRFAQDTFAFFLATRDLKEASLAQNLYMTAFSMARRRQLGVNPAALVQRLQAVTQEELQAAAVGILGNDRSAAVMVVPGS